MVSGKGLWKKGPRGTRQGIALQGVAVKVEGDFDPRWGALATCGTFVYEAVAREQNIPLQSVVATVEADFDPRGVKGERVNPRIQALRVRAELGGVSAAQAKTLAEAFQARCPIYTTLTRAAPIAIDTVIK